MSSEPQPPRDANWPKDEFGRGEALSQAWLVWSALIIAVLAIGGTLAYRHLGHGPVVVAYCAQDQVYAEPILRDFETATGIRVRAVYDSEAVKTVGLANRLLAERDHPQCDVFWGNEEFRTRQLAAREVFRVTNGWAAFGYRTRRIVVNAPLLPSEADRPRSLLDLTNSQWVSKTVLAYPQFGTTATHFHALRQVWGEAAWLSWCQGLVAGKAAVVDGNSVVVKLVGKGEAAAGLTDSDDIAAGRREGLPVEALPLAGDSLLIPNTVGVIRNAPHPEAAQSLFQYLQSAAVAERLVAAGALEGATDREAKEGTIVLTAAMWDQLLRDLEATTAQLGRVFLR